MKPTNKSKRKWTIKEWKDNTALNSTSSYGLVVNCVALFIKEYGEEGVHDHFGGLSGSQYEMALALSKVIPDFKEDSS